MEKDKARCEVLTELLDDALILNGDGTDRQLLLEEGLIDGGGICHSDEYGVRKMYSLRCMRRKIPARSW